MSHLDRYASPDDNAQFAAVARAGVSDAARLAFTPRMEPVDRIAARYR